MRILCYLITHSTVYTPIRTLIKDHKNSTNNFLSPLTQYCDYTPDCMNVIPRSDDLCVPFKDNDQGPIAVRAGDWIQADSCNFGDDPASGTGDSFSFRIQNLKKPDLDIPGARAGSGQDDKLHPYRIFNGDNATVYKDVDGNRCWRVYYAQPVVLSWD